MTLKDLVLEVRQRLQDMRTREGTIITDITEDGIRWSAANLLGIVNDAFTETTRLIITAYDNNTVTQQLANDIMQAHQTANYTAAGLELPATAFFVTSVNEQGKTDSPYGYTTPRRYYDYAAQSASPKAGEKFYTVVYDAENNVRKLLLLPAEEKAIIYTYVYSIENLSLNDSNQVLPFYGVKDLLKDVAEREARDREKNWERSLVLDKRIAIKLGISQ
jgi:hypothetical protein